jgi:hypothetical protein
MVAMMKFSKYLRSAFQYNENKVKSGAAEFIHSANYGKDTSDLSGRDRIARLKKQAILNGRAQLKCVHISLNFDPSDKIDKNTLQQIADGYMKGIGFGAQPDLVYRHDDAGHPHIHILTTSIRPDGTRIPTYNKAGVFMSERASQEVAQEFGLVHAKGPRPVQPRQNRSNEPEKVLYGKTETHNAVTTVLDAILDRHQYTSLAELNAILRKYNVMADQGSERSRIRQNGGLVYRVLNDQGKKVGAPIKASHINGKPTLKFLEERFAQNASLCQLAKVDPHPTLTQDNTQAEVERQKHPKKKRKRLHL